VGACGASTRLAAKIVGNLSSPLMVRQGVRRFKQGRAVA
jgi:hypothetical protein